MEILNPNLLLVTIFPTITSPSIGRNKIYRNRTRRWEKVINRVLPLQWQAPSPGKIVP